MLLLVFVFVFIDVLGFSLLLPLLPHFALSIGASTLQYSILVSSNAIAQVVSAPFIGLSSDIYGRRPLLLLCCASSALSFLMCSYATTFSVLLLSRVLDGALGGNISLAQAYISDITREDPSGRSKGMALVGVAFACAFVIGPAAGGALSHAYGTSTPLMIAACLAMFNMVFLYFALPESLLPRNRRTLKGISWVDFVPFASLWNLMSSSWSLASILVVKFWQMMVFTAFEVTLGIFSRERLGLTPKSSGYLLAFVGLLYAIAQGARTKRRLHRVCSIVLGLSFTAMMYSSTYTQLMLSLIPLSLAIGIGNTSVNVAIGEVADKQALGETFGVTAAVGSITRILSPICSTTLSQYIGYQGLGWTYFSCIIVSLVVLRK